MKKHLYSIILILVFFIGLSVLLYPTISNHINSLHQSHAIADYVSKVSNCNKEDFSREFESADKYNKKIASNSLLFYQPNLIQNYKEILNISSTGIMGYINIDKIGVELPIYHTADENVLQIAVGHLQGTSLPVGGENTHCVLSGHTGLPSAKLFSDLDKLEIDDTFTITVLDRILTYKVDQIKIVLPTQVDDLQVVKGKDYCTLVTCTPYGVNSHRLLVRGTRIETIKEEPIINNSLDSHETYRTDPAIIIPIIATPMLLVILIVLLIKYCKRNRRKK